MMLALPRDTAPLIAMVRFFVIVHTQVSSPVEAEALF